MVEIVTKTFDPEREYGIDNCPPCDVQADFFNYALQEGDLIEKPIRTGRGYFFKEFDEILTRTSDELQKIDPSLTLEHIMPTSYQSEAVQTTVKKLDERVRRRKQVVADTKRASVLNLVRSRLVPELATQVIPRGVLSTPPYCSQNDGWDSFERYRGCTNACFRMIFGGITGWTPDQTPLSSELVRRYGTSVVDDRIYSALFQTEIFHEICQRKVRTVELIGADFSEITKLANKAKERQPHADIFCMVNLASQNGGTGVWHSAVLLDAVDDIITLHDPSEHTGGEKRMVESNLFIKRWAEAYNRAQLVIAS